MSPNLRCHKLSWLVVVLVSLALVGVAEADRKKRKKRKKDDQEEKAPPEPAAAQPEEPPPPPPPDNTPWGKGVSAEQKEQAQALLGEGNDLFLAKDYKGALEKYLAAIKSWDHPAIRFNIVRTYIQLDKNVEAFENLEHALKYGADPLEETVFQEAQNYKKVLENAIGVLEVTCEQKDVTVTVDGNDFLTCPGSKSMRVTPTKHSVVGKKKDFLTLTKNVGVFPGKTEKVAVKLISLEDATITERRWDTWKPWAVVGGGAAVAGLGVLLQLKAQSDFDQYGEEIAQQCGETGCTPDMIAGSTKDLESTARLENRLAIGSMVTGGVLVVGGLTMVILNRPRPVIPEQPPDNSPQVTPAVTANSIGLNLSGRF